MNARAAMAAGATAARRRAAAAIAVIGTLLAPVIACDAAAFRGLPPIAPGFVALDERADRDAGFRARLPGGTLDVSHRGELRYALGEVVLRERFAGYRDFPRGASPGVARVGFVRGGGQPLMNLATFEAIELGEVAPGIRCTLHARDGNVEKVFTVAPGADPGRLVIDVDGATSLEVAGDGTLHVATPRGESVFTRPVAFQMKDGARVPVAARYSTQAARSADRRSPRYGFIVGAYDRSRPLFIDPLVQGTYLGGSALDQINAIAIHPVTGDVYVAGTTHSTDLPLGNGGYQTTNGAAYNGFVARFNANLTTLLNATYWGGSFGANLTALAIDAINGHIYVAGDALSVNPLPGGFQPGNAGGHDGIVLRFNTTLTSLTAGTYIGGSGDDYLTAIAIHPVSGEVVVAGYSTSLNFPSCVNSGGVCQTPAQSAHAADLNLTDGVVARLKPDLSGLLLATYFGSNGDDQLQAVAIHPLTGEVYVAGYTASFSLACTVENASCQNAAQISNAGGVDGMIARFNAALTGLLQVTYAGGSNVDTLWALAIHPVTGDVYAAGHTYSTDFPCTTAGAICAAGAQPAHSSDGGLSDGIVVRLNRELTRFLQATYVGGSGLDQLFALAIHPVSGEVFAGGYTNSTDFPCTNGGGGACSVGAVAGNTGGGDAVLARFNAALTQRLQATYLGDTTPDQFNALAVSIASGDVYAAGATNGTQVQCTSTGTGCANGAQSVAGGNGDGLVERITADLTIADRTPDAFDFLPQSKVPRSTLRTSNPMQLAGFTGHAPIHADGSLGSQYCLSSTANCSTCDVSAYTSALGTAVAGNFVCARHVSAGAVNSEARTLVHVGGGAGAFITVTGSLLAAPCTLDIDGNGVQDALTDGLLIMRALMGVTGTALTNGTIGANATRTTAADILFWMNTRCGGSFGP